MRDIVVKTVGELAGDITAGDFHVLKAARRKTDSATDSANCASARPNYAT